MPALWIGTANQTRFVNLAHATQITVLEAADRSATEVAARLADGTTVALRSFDTLAEAQAWVCDILNDGDPD